MGTRYFITVTCPECKEVANNVYYAPTCGFTDWKCPQCGEVVDLAEYTGISYEDASNLEELKAIVKDVSESHQSRTKCWREC